MTSSPQSVDKRPPKPDHSAALISHETAREALARLVNSAYQRPGEKAHFSIPVRDSDEDVVLMAYIAQQEHRESLKR